MLNNIFLSFFAQIGNVMLKLTTSLGNFVKFTFLSIKGIFLPPLNFLMIFKHFNIIGFHSLPLVGMTSFFTGAVLALQSYSGFSRFSAESSIATVVVLSITRELGPVLTGLMIAARIGSSIAAEVATMRVTEQIDALYSLSTDPIKYLVTPRLIATIISMPCLVLVSDIIGVMGGYIVSVYKLDFNPNRYLIDSFKYLQMIDVISGLVKASFFGFFIVIISCYQGYKAKGGARGVGASTIKAVANSSIVILLCNYLITECFFSK